MANAVAARMYGDDYQARVFWLQACRLFDDRTKVTAVEIEAANIKSLDDVVVHYSGMTDTDGDVIANDYYQVKFHMALNGAITWKEMIDPAFINASSVSLLQRIKNAQEQFAPDGRGCRFYIYSPWGIHPDDSLAKVLSNVDGRIRWETLAEGGERSEMGKLRVAWREHLGLGSDEELRVVLAPVRFEQGHSHAQIERTLNDKLRLAGLKAVEEGAMNHPYEGLARKLVQSGRAKIDRKAAEALCKRENLWIGKTPLEPDTRRIGIRSFVRFAENLEDETDEILCLLKHFDGRYLRDAGDWDKVILPDVRDFLRRCVQPGSRCLIHLPVHGTIAFLSGWCLDQKSGVNVALVQTGVQGRQLWQLNPCDADTSTFSDWQVTSLPMAQGKGDIALAISITHDIEHDVAAYVERCVPSISRIMHCDISATGGAAIRGADHAGYLARRLSGLLKAQRTNEERSGRLHIFFAAPNAFVFFLGQLSRSFGPLTLYEYDFESNLPGAYCPSVSIPPQQT